MTKEELIELERNYDENLTFQPTINKRSSKMVTSGERSSMSESRRIDELCKKLSSSALRKDPRRSSGRVSDHHASVVSSVESERNNPLC